MTRAAQPSPGKTTLLIVAGRKISVSRPSSWTGEAQRRPLMRTNPKANIP
jgi:hypothetical protein